MTVPLPAARTGPRTSRRGPQLLLALGLCVVVAAIGWILLDRQQDRARAKEFADRAALMRANTVTAVDFFKHVAARGQAPTADELRAWRDLNTRVDAEVLGAAAKLRSVPERARALRWVRTHQALRTARVSARVIVVSRLLFDYCTERQQFVAEVVKGFSLPQRMAALNPCFDQQGQPGDAGLHALRGAIDRLEVEEARQWAGLSIIAPEVGR